MRRNRRNNAKKERIIMIVSSVFVLTALTMTGIYMKSNQVESQDDGYTIDFTELGENVDDKLQEIAQNNQIEADPGTSQNNSSFDFPEEMVNLEDDLDYTPMEVGSGQVELPGLTPGLQQEAPILDDLEVPGETNGNLADAEPKPESGMIADAVPEPEPETEPEPQPQEDTLAINAIVTRSLHFEESEGLLRPLSGEVLIPFDMEHTVQFYTLNNYKCNPALIIGAVQGTEVIACAEGKVINIYEDEEIGHAVTMDLGDGYQITYGQLEGINVTMNSYVQAGEKIATVAEPTKYYCVEGSNLYLELTANGTPVNPEPLFRQGL